MFSYYIENGTPSGGGSSPAWACASLSARLIAGPNGRVRTWLRHYFETAERKRYLLEKIRDVRFAWRNETSQQRPGQKAHGVDEAGTSDVLSA